MAQDAFPPDEERSRVGPSLIFKVEIRTEVEQLVVVVCPHDFRGDAQVWFQHRFMLSACYVGVDPHSLVRGGKDESKSQYEEAKRLQARITVTAGCKTHGSHKNSPDDTFCKPKRDWRK
jgi:hypothetical protein